MFFRWRLRRPASPLMLVVAIIIIIINIISSIMLWTEVQKVSMKMSDEMLSGWKARGASVSSRRRLQRKQFC